MFSTIQGTERQVHIGHEAEIYRGNNLFNNTALIELVEPWLQSRTVWHISQALASIHRLGHPTACDMLNVFLYEVNRHHIRYHCDTIRCIAQTNDHRLLPRFFQKNNAAGVSRRQEFPIFEVDLIP
jgi:hypothetical protein